MRPNEGFLKTKVVPIASEDGGGADEDEDENQDEGGGEMDGEIKNTEVDLKNEEVDLKEGGGSGGIAPGRNASVIPQL